MIVRAAPPEHLDWLAKRAGVTLGPGLRAIEAVHGDQIAAMVGYDGWTPNACAMHVAIDEPIAVRSLIRPAFALPFVELKKAVVIATVLSTNKRSLEFVCHLGFRRVMQCQDWWAPRVDMIWLEMRREECRWIQSARRAA